MIRVSQIRMNPAHDMDELRQYINRKLHISEKDLKDIRIVRRSLDARHKDDIHYVYTVDADIDHEEEILHRFRNNRNVTRAINLEYRLPEKGTEWMSYRPCVVGAGPAGLFCAYFLAVNGFSPILIEQGEDVDSRKRTVNKFLNGKSPLDPFSNIQFGEGGAGTFSDGKLTSSVKDSDGRKAMFLKIFHQHGAPESILYDAKPHIGTDVICRIVKSMRQKIIASGGEVWFNSRFIGYHETDGRLTSVLINRNGTVLNLTCSDLVLATGHSARDTFKMLFENGVEMQPKPFAVGVRAEHLQHEINDSQYGDHFADRYIALPPAEYKLTAHTSDGHSVYSFCMCPGGYVINSSSEPGHLCVNGMSYSGRDGSNANAAIVVNINPEDIGAVNDPMAAIRFQRELEEKAYSACNGSVPVQRLEDFIACRASTKFGRIEPMIKGSYSFADINNILPGFVSADIKEAFELFGSQITGYNDPDTVISAVESRTSSPIRIVRDDSFESSVKGIYPCGEGAGYAGGITSAAIDGIKVFEAIYRKYRVR